jgi:hypothetical protein
MLGEGETAQTEERGGGKLREWEAVLTEDGMGRAHARRRGSSSNIGRAPV